ncbi:hypothetical protein [Mycobacterium triplex]|uniref:Lipoprotein n=1 Tax=Mycobacterium triplex TaxID=47839 RepID=A0A024JQC0_9MYCO|nr:hypothetical protein [Mycobacterium triplex]CDO85811.1 hypothetical protein BN973_00144 [Mycobacterium triplex]
MSALKTKLIIAALLMAAATTAGCTVPLTIDCGPGAVCTGG